MPGTMQPLCCYFTENVDNYNDDDDGFNRIDKYDKCMYVCMNYVTT